MIGASIAVENLNCGALKRHGVKVAKWRINKKTSK
jgi:hypothetical protein